MQLNGKATDQIRIDLGFLNRRSYCMTTLVQIPIFYEMANLNIVEKEGGNEGEGPSARKSVNSYNLTITLSPPSDSFGSSVP